MAVKAEAQACCPTGGRHFSKWFLTITSGVALVVLGYLTFVLFQHVISLTYTVNSLNESIRPRVGFAAPASRTILNKETGAQGFWLAYTPCPETFTGACDSAAVYRLAKDGSKEVLIADVRRLPGAPQTNELMQPMSASTDGNILVLGAWAFGGNRNPNDKRIWLYDVSKGAIVVHSNAVPGNALFSPDYAYAAYAVEDNGDIRDVMIVNLSNDKTVSGAQADSGRSFKNQNGQADLAWKDAKNLTVSEYSVPSGNEASSIPVKVGEKNIRVK